MICCGKISLGSARLIGQVARPAVASFGKISGPPPVIAPPAGSLGRLQTSPVSVRTLSIIGVKAKCCWPCVQEPRDGEARVGGVANR